LPDGCGVEIQKESWPALPIFGVMQSIGDVDEDEMYRAFNMGIGMVFIVNPADMDATINLMETYKIGTVISGKGVNIQ